MRTLRFRAGETILTEGEAGDTAFVILSGSVSAALVRRAAEVGARGYQLKGDDPEGLLAAVRAVARGGTAWSDGALAFLPSADSLPGCG